MLYAEAHRTKAKFCSRKCWNKKGVKRGQTFVVVICEACKKRYRVAKWRVKKTRFCSLKCLGVVTNKGSKAARLKAVVTHGMSGTPEHRCWMAMLARCRGEGWWKENGIIVYHKWRKDFMAFYNHLGPIPGPGYTVDRYPNNLGNYEPGNVRWATKAEQGWSKRGKKHSPEWKRAASLRTRGQNSPTSKLTDADVRAIRALTGTAPYDEIGKRFGVSYWTVRDIQKRETWKHLE
jgi:hypothetical protein